MGVINIFRYISSIKLEIIIINVILDRKLEICFELLSFLLWSKILLILYENRIGKNQCHTF